MAHILYIVSWYKTPESPMAGSFFHEFAKAFQRRGHRVGILVVDHQMAFSARFHKQAAPKDYLDDEIPVMYHRSQSVVPGIRPINFTTARRSVKKTFTRYVRQFGKPDVIHAQAVAWAGILTHSIAEKFIIPYVITEHSSNLVYRSDFQHKLYVNAIREAYTNAETVFSVSSAVANQISRQFTLKRPIKVIPNLVPDQFFQTPQPLSITSEPKCIAIGNLLPVKQFHLAIQAFSIVCDTWPGASLTIVGDGPLKNQLTNLAEELGVNQRIRWAGILTRDDVRTAIQNHHILVSSSEYETFGITIIEALAQGRPVVATNSGGPQDSVRHGKDGELVMDHTPEALAAAILRTIGRYHEFDQAEISQSCQDRFSESAVYQQYVEALLPLPFNEPKI